MKELEIGIVGGGLAGLTAAIHLSSLGFKVQLFEKEIFPHHKVCGEYLSREILPYLKSLDISIESLQPVTVDQLVYSNVTGKPIETPLPLGAIGVSRYALDNLLFKKALKNGVQFINTTVTGIEFKEDDFTISSVEGLKFKAKVVLGAFGKRSLLDKKLDRTFSKKKTRWLAVKGHYQHKTYPPNIVALHNFNGGYCGLSKTETGAVNVCYLATYSSFSKYKDINKYKEKVLSQNKHLNEFFKNATPLFKMDISIAQISFDKKDLIKDRIIMLGDAAGLIHPLCGNGMAMAIHSAKIAVLSLKNNYNGHKLNRAGLEKEYIANWNKNFSTRLKTGRILQKILLNSTLAGISRRALNVFPSLLPAIIKRTHGKPVL